MCIRDSSQVDGAEDDATAGLVNSRPVVHLPATIDPVFALHRNAQSLEAGLIARIHDHRHRPASHRLHIFIVHTETNQSSAYRSFFLRTSSPIPRTSPCN